MKTKRLAAVLAAIAMLCSGCSMDVENFLRPPAAQGEQQPIQNALETYINDSGEANRRYTLQYPSEGDYTSAFVICDERGVPIDEDDAVTPDPSLAVAFYLFSGANEEVHINLLRRDGGEWISVADVSGFGSDILQVAFGDLDGDGMGELVAGFGTYNSRDHRLAVLSMADGLTVLDDRQMYTRLFVGHMTRADHDSLLTMRIGEANTVTATLSTLQEGRLVTLGTAPLDGYIQQFGDMLYSYVGEGVSGLYVDGVKSGGTLVTELIYYDGERLCTPFYDADTNMNTVTARLSGLAVRDIDGDVTAEIPRCTLFAGYDASAPLSSAAWLTDWMQYDVASGELRQHLTTVVNVEDGYFVTLSDTQRDQWTAVYDSLTGMLTFTDAASGDVYMRLVPYKDELPYEYDVLFAATEKSAGIAVQYDESVLNVEKVRYMVSKLV